VALILLLLGPVEKLWIWIPLLILASLAALANFLGVRDMGESRELLLLLYGDHRTLAGSNVGGLAANRAEMFCAKVKEYLSHEQTGRLYF